MAQILVRDMDEAVDWRLVESLKDAFSESDLPIMVDVVDVNSVSPAFRGVIERGYEVICGASGGREKKAGVA